MNKQAPGFTLIEVLIASFIMFISLAVFTMIFRSAVISSDKAESNVSSSGYTGLIISKISAEVKLSHALNNTLGSGELLGRSYRWSAKVIDSANPPARYFGNELSQAEHHAKLWQVELTVQIGNKVTEFSFEEVTW